MRDLSPGEIVISYIIAIWLTIWKGASLWRAARENQRNWFIVLLLIPFLFPPLFYLSFGILDIIYLFWFAKKRLTLAEIKGWFQKTFFTKPQSK